MNPIASDANLYIYIPDEINISKVTSIKGQGSRVNSVLTSSFSATERTVSITGFNNGYLEPEAISYVSIGLVTNPINTLPTSTFTVEFYDSNDNGIESCLTGIYF